MQPTPAISVVLPYFNAEKTLKKAIESVLNQSFSDFEVILVNNNSTDGSENIATAFQLIDHRIRLADEKRQGVAFSSNHGFDLTRAPLIARMDADDLMFPDRLKKQFLWLQANPNTGLVGGQVRYQGDAANVGFQHYVDWSNSLTSSEAIFLNRFVELPVVNPSIMFRKAIYSQYGGYDHGDFPEDYEMILRWLDQEITMDKINEPMLEWFDHPSRLTRTDPRYSEAAFYQVKAKYLSKWLKKEIQHKAVWVWGAGKLGRKRSKFLQDRGTEIVGYIDVKSRQLSLPCIHYRDIPKPGELFIVSYVANRGKREEVRQYLLKLGYVEGVDFLLAA